MNNEKRTAVFPGSFDPMTTGHLALLKRVVPLFDEVIIAIGLNSEKKSFMAPAERVDRIKRAVAAFDNVRVELYNCLTTEFCRQVGAKYIVRGVRDNSDFEYERKIADINRLIAPDIETVILFADAMHATVSSSMVRELAAFGMDVSQWMA
jgi:pantetheine-phosphate adenylyltransferase